MNKLFKINGWIILLFAMIYVDLFEQYKNSTFDFPFLLAIIDTIIRSIIILFYPIYYKNKNNVSYKKYRNICLYNILIIFGISIILGLLTNYIFLGVLGAIIYFCIGILLYNDNTKYSKNNIKKDNYKKQSKCKICNQIIEDKIKYDGYCKACYTIKKDVASEEADNIEEEIFVCDECGSTVSETDNICPNCGAIFTEEGNNSNNEFLSKQETEYQKNSNCVESSTKEKNVVKKENFDVKYDRLIKLKKLYDKKILTKEEFEHEKGIILESDE